MLFFVIILNERFRVTLKGATSSYYSSFSYVGGITGYANNGSITDCAAANGDIETTGRTVYIGRIVGSISSSRAANNFSNLDMLVNSAAVSDNANNGTAKTLAELQTQATYESAVNGDGLGGLGWEFGNSGGAPCGRCQRAAQAILNYIDRIKWLKMAGG